MVRSGPVIHARQLPNLFNKLRVKLRAAVAAAVAFGVDLSEVYVTVDKGNPAEYAAAKFIVDYAIKIGLVFPVYGSNKSYLLIKKDYNKLDKEAQEQVMFFGAVVYDICNKVM